VVTSSSVTGLARERQHLVERALRVAHAALGGARDERQGVVADLDLLGVGNLAQLLDDRLGGNRAELEHLRARQDGVGNLVDLGRGHHEDHVGRRLLDRLQQRVERGRESWCTSSMMNTL
jgi:hypothetical protein